MSQFESYLRLIMDQLDLPPNAKQRIRDEAMSHLKDEMEQCRKEGMDSDTAESKAIERFGKADIIGQLTSAVLSEKQRRYRTTRKIKAVGLAGVLIFVAVFVGVWLGILNDVVSSDKVSSDIPRVIWLILTIGTTLGCFAFLGTIAGKLFHKSALIVTIATVGVMIVQYAVSQAFPYLGDLKSSIGVIRAEDTITDRVVNSFLLRLYKSSSPVLVLALLCLPFCRLFKVRALLVTALSTSVLSALLWALSHAYGPSFPYSLKWADLLSTGAWLLVLMLLIGVLAETLTHIRSSLRRDTTRCADIKQNM